MPVGERASQPPLVDVELGTPPRCLRNRLLRLALRSNKKDAAALRHRFKDRMQGRIQQRHRLCKVNDVNSVPFAVYELTHERVPAVRLVTVVDAALDELAHGKFGK